MKNWIKKQLVDLTWVILCMTLMPFVLIIGLFTESLIMLSGAVSNEDKENA